MTSVTVAVVVETKKPTTVRVAVVVAEEVAVSGASYARPCLPVVEFVAVEVLFRS